MAKRLLNQLAHLSLAQKRLTVAALEQADRLHSRSDMLRAAMASETKVAVTYTKRDGSARDDILNPYEVKPHPSTGRLVLYATHGKHGAGQIHSFYLKNLEVRENLTRAGFKPRWPTQAGSV